jgi:hypothetical protein
MTIFQAGFRLRPAGVMLIVALSYALMIAVRLARFDFDASRFICAGTEFCTADQLPTPITLFSDTGYDGQFYYRLAMAPFTNQQTAFGIKIDNPGYRQQRILYPLLAGALSLGRPTWLPWTMILVNYLAICGLAFVAGLFACIFDRNALWGLAIVFYPGLILSLYRDLTDALAISLIVTGLFFWHRRRNLLGSFTLGLAVLARETTVLLAGAMLVAWAWRMFFKKARWSEGACLIIPLATFAAWQLWIAATWGYAGVLFGRAYGLGPLMSALSAFVAGLLSGFPTAHKVLGLCELTLLGGTTLLAALALSRSPIDGGVKLAWAAYFVLACKLSGAVWFEDWEFMRGTAELILLGFLILLSSRESRLFGALVVLEFVIWNTLALIR